MDEPLEHIIDDIFTLTHPEKTKARSLPQQKLMAEIHTAVRELVGEDWGFLSEQESPFKTVSQDLRKDILAWLGAKDDEMRGGLTGNIQSVFVLWKPLVESALLSIKRERDKVKDKTALSDLHLKIRKLEAENAYLENEKLQRQVEKKDETIQQVQSNKADAAVKIEQDYFKAHAKWNTKEMLLWAVGALFFAACAIRYIYNETHTGAASPTPRWTTVMLLHEIGPRLVVVSIFTYLAVLCAGNSRASNHNRMLNLQRQAALETFPWFRDSVINHKEILHDVVLKAMDPLFGRHQTGYCNGEQPEASANTTIGAFKTVRDVMK